MEVGRGGPCEGRKLGLDGNKRNATGKGGGPGLLVIIAVGGGIEPEAPPGRDRRSGGKGALWGKSSRRRAAAWAGLGPNLSPFPLKKVETLSPSGLATWFSNTQGHLPVSE